MAGAKDSPKTPRRGSVLYQARVITDSADTMREALKGREIELVGRGAHRRADGTLVAEVIATQAVLSALAKTLPEAQGRVEIRPRRRIAARTAQLGQGDRYRDEGGIPHGVGRKE